MQAMVIIAPRGLDEDRGRPLPKNNLHPMVEDVYNEVEVTAMAGTRLRQVAAQKDARIRHTMRILDAKIGAVQQFSDNIEKYWKFMAVVLVGAASFSVISGIGQLWNWIEKKRKNKLAEKELEVTAHNSHKTSRRSEATRIHARGWEHNYCN